MSRKLILYIASSLNGKIADAEGRVDWLESMPNPDKLDYGYAEFYDSIDTTIQGNATYKQVMSWGIDFPYAGKTNYVFTRNVELQDTADVQFVAHDHVDFVQALKAEPGKAIWLIGGGQVVTLLLNAKLIDEIRIFTMPIILRDGIDLFGSLPDESHLTLLQSKAYSTGVVESRYAAIT
jgi:dihydrofolate reductase